MCVCVHACVYVCVLMDGESKSGMNITEFITLSLMYMCNHLFMCSTTINCYHRYQSSMPETLKCGLE